MAAFSITFNKKHLYQPEEVHLEFDAMKLEIARKREKEEARRFAGGNGHDRGNNGCNRDTRVQDLSIQV